MKKINSLALTKLLLDPRRRTILDLAKERPVTVAELAAAMEEKPSRLYYHVKLLEEAELLELVETRQQGNLVEKLYRAKKRQSSFRLDPELLSQHSDEILGEVRNVLEPGLRLLANEMKEGKSRPDKHVDLSISIRQLTGAEWREAHRHAFSSIGSQPSGEKDEEEVLTPEEADRKSKYAFVLLSYRIEDAEPPDE
ncbi:hypothetical protein J31TS4_21230 [Paenibacillus sp. J31TS4]|uniref:transcriptional regulator n=1 Tax=Paenibacillus sp. J31TS4 TaxID=2807195 RepID=UPI001B2AA19A|nr:winged helix-turn-helix domain-containing protein [Paenibacillus sp. J31TS4]GIP38843.1 hypothetical protein J31TS4_21230 [Paenibacillus sp. J31TS4]